MPNAAYRTHQRIGKSKEDNNKNHLTSNAESVIKISCIKFAVYIRRGYGYIGEAYVPISRDSISSVQHMGLQSVANLKLQHVRIKVQ